MPRYLHPIRHTPLSPDDLIRTLPINLALRLRTLAICWIAVASIAFLVDLFRQTYAGLTNGIGRPFGDDFLNYWSGAFLAWHHRAADIYNWMSFHAFEESVVGASLDFYHYSYPPVLPVLTAPLAFLPYAPALVLWLIAGWLCFYVALRAAAAHRRVLMLALAVPAVFVSFVGGQNGTWTAALLGGGLSVLERKPIVAGILFGLLIYKPQLGLLLPVALVAGRHWRAFFAATATAVILVSASVLLFGADLWTAYFHNIPTLREVILEDGSGVWHRMLSVFVAARRLGVSVSAAYATQGTFALVAAVVVIVAWYRDVPQAAKNALLVLGTFLATPYLQDYDLVIGAFVAVWLASLYPAHEMPRAVLWAAGLILLVPLVGVLLAKLTGYEFGPLFIVPAFIIVAQAAFGGKPQPR